MESFLAAQVVDPFDPAPMLILADHLEEQGDAAGAAVFRGLEGAGLPSLVNLAAMACLASKPWHPEEEEYRNDSDGPVRGLATGGAPRMPSSTLVLRMIGSDERPPRAMPGRGMALESSLPRLLRNPEGPEARRVGMARPPLGNRGGDPLILSRLRGVVSLAGHGARAWEPEELFPGPAAMAACLAAAAGEHAAAAAIAPGGVDAPTRTSGRGVARVQGSRDLIGASASPGGRLPPPALTLVVLAVAVPSQRVKILGLMRPGW